MCSLMHGQKSFTIFVLEILLKYQVTNWWLKNLLMWSNKEADFFPWNQQKFHFSWNGPTVYLYPNQTWVSPSKKPHYREQLYLMLALAILSSQGEIQGSEFAIDLIPHIKGLHCHLVPLMLTIRAKQVQVLEFHLG